MQNIRPIFSTGPVPGTNLINLTRIPSYMDNTLAQLFTASAEHVLKINYSTSEDRVFAYDLSGNLIMEGSFHDYGDDSSDEPVIEHVWLGNHFIAG
jgi:hypothetical protein